jgi:hypothetical protein
MKMTAQLCLFHLFQFQNFLLLILLLFHLICHLPSFLLCLLLFLLLILYLLIVLHAFLVLQVNGGRLSMLLNLKLKHQSFGLMMKRRMLILKRQTQSQGKNLVPTSRLCMVRVSQTDGDRDAALVENGTWEVVDLPPGQMPIGSGWVFKVKHNQDGSIECFKARLVAKGYSQHPGLDYNESFAPTFRPATLRIIMALAAVEDLELRFVDITSAFTNGDLDEEIYMKQPEGFHIGSPHQVCRFRKSLYGLKQSACQWNKKLHSDHKKLTVSFGLLAAYKY